MWCGDADRRSVKIVERFISNDRDELRTPTAQARIFLDRENPMRAGDRTKNRLSVERTSERTSITSQSMPCSAFNRSAASNARGTMSASARIGCSLPGRAIAALPSVSTNAPRTQCSICIRLLGSSEVPRRIRSSPFLVWDLFPHEHRARLQAVHHINDVGDVTERQLARSIDVHHTGTPSRQLAHHGIS